ncbi:MAG: hypothetical protein HLX50_06570 [Alteromonadaceae bacterium]|nr:hypothetical protein [Alteromonadaceae bacterium]
MSEKNPPVYIPPLDASAQLNVVSPGRGYTGCELLIYAPGWTEQEFWLPVQMAEGDFPMVHMLFRQDGRSSYRLVKCHNWDQNPESAKAMSEQAQKLSEEIGGQFRSALAEALSGLVSERAPDARASIDEQSPLRAQGGPGPHLG